MPERDRAANPKLTVLADAGACAHAAAERVAGAIEAGARHIALAGGTTPRRAYELLAARAELDWSAVELWFGDERCVPPDHPDSNYHMVREALLDPAAIPAAQVHRVAGEQDPEAAARAYGATLPERLDLALLGLGEDGHTASLFPGDPLLEDPAPARAVTAAKPPPRRITLGLGVLRGASERIILAAGAGKHDALAAVLRGPDPAYPASLVDAELIVDEAAYTGVAAPDPATASTVSQGGVT